MSVNWDLSDGFLMITLGLQVLEEEAHRVRYTHKEHVLTTHPTTVDINLNHRAGDGVHRVSPL